MENASVMSQDMFELQDHSIPIYAASHSGCLVLDIWYFKLGTAWSIEAHCKQNIQQAEVGTERKAESKETFQRKNYQEFDQTL